MMIEGTKTRHKPYLQKVSETKVTMEEDLTGYGAPDVNHALYDNDGNRRLSPPWEKHNEHPCSLCWRMGCGESYIMAWWEWWRQNYKDKHRSEKEEITYFQEHSPPPHCWLAFVVEAIWDPVDGDDQEAMILDDSVEESDLKPEVAICFEKLKASGLGGYQDYVKDSRDPKWLDT